VGLSDIEGLYRLSMSSYAMDLLEVSWSRRRYFEVPCSTKPHPDRLPGYQGKPKAGAMSFDPALQGSYAVLFKNPAEGQAVGPERVRLSAAVSFSADVVLFQNSIDRSSGLSVVMAEDSSQPFQPSDGP